MNLSKNKNSLGLEKRTSGKFPARRLLHSVFLGMLVILCMMIVLSVISNQAMAESYKVQVTYNNPSDGTADVTPGQWHTYTVDVKNIGENFGEQINLTATIDPNKVTQGWSVSPALLNFNLGASATETKQIKIRPPSNASYEDDGVVTVKAEVVGHEIEPGGSSTVTLYANVLQVYGVATSVQNNDNVHDVSDGGFTIFSLNITNKGNGDDTFAFTYSGLPPGWPTPAFSHSSVSDLPSGETFPLTFTVYVPKNTESTAYTLWATATSQGNPSKSSSAAVTVQVIPSYKVSIESSPSTSEGKPGDQVDFQITIRNKGNTDEDFAITQTLVEGETWSSSLSIGEGLQYLDYQENLTFILSVTIDNDALDEHYNRVQVKVSSNTDPTVNKSIICRTNVAQIFGVSVPSPAPKSADPGETVLFIVNIRNTGNGVDNIKIATSAGTSSASVLNGMQPDEIRSINVTYKVDNKAPQGLIEITVTATSEGNKTVSDYGTLQVDVNPVYKITLTSAGDSQLSGYPGGDVVVFLVGVKNAGTGTDDINLYIGGQKPTWATLSTFIVNDLAPGATAVVYLNVTIPNGQKVNEWWINVTGESGEGGKSINSTFAFKLFVEQVFDVTLSSSDQSNSIPKGTTTKYYINVTNSGSGHDVFTVAVGSDEPITFWAAWTPEIFGLDSGKIKTVTLTIEVPQDAVPGDHDIWLSVTSQNDSAVTKSLTTTTIVTQSYEVRIAGGKDYSGEAPPKTVISYRIQLYNRGTGEDSFIIEKVGLPVSNHPDWAVPSVNITPKIQSLGIYLLWVNISIPEDTKGDTIDYLKILIISDGDKSTPPAQAYFWINTTITPVRDAKLSLRDIFYRKPGDIINVTVQLTNTGTAEDTFTLEDITPPPNDGWGHVPLPATVILAPGQSVYMNYTITVDSKVKMDDSPITLTLAVNSTGADGIVETKEIKVHINQTYEVDIRTTKSELPGDPGKNVVFSIQIKNLGNFNDTFNLEDDVTSEVGFWEKSSIDLGPDQSRYVNYTVIIKSDHDTTDILVTLSAISSDPSGNTKDSLQIIVHVNPRYEVYLLAQTNQKEVKGGGNVTFSLGITNRGTDVDTFDLEAPGGTTGFWATINPSDPTNTTVVINKKQTKYVTILVSPPEGTDTGLYDIVIRVTSQGNKSVTADYTFYAKVKATYDVFIYAGNPHKKVKAGDPATFTIYVENKGNGDDQYNFYDTGVPAGWTISIQPSTLSVNAGTTGNVQVTVTTSTVSASGGYEFNITAESINDKTKKSTTTLIVEVEQVYKVALPSTPSTQYVDPGDIVSYKIDVTNNGNGEDEIELKLEGDVGTWSWLYYSPTENSTTIHVSPPPRGNLTVWLFIKPPSKYWNIGSPTGSYVIKIKAKSLDDPAPSPASAEVTVTTEVNDVYAFTLEGSGSKSGIPGDIVTFSITITNEASIEDKFNLRLKGFSTATGGTISYWEGDNPNPFISSVTIPEGGQQTIPFDIEIPSPTDKLYEIPPGIYIVEVEVKSQGDLDIVKTQNFTVRVNELYQAWITETVKDGSAGVGGSVTYVLQIENKGNTQDNLRVEIEADPNVKGSKTWANVTLGGQEITGVNLLLNASEVRTINLIVSIPNRGDPSWPSPAPSSVTLTVRVLPSDKDNDDEVQVTTNIDAINDFTLTSQSPQNTKEADAGDSITFSLQVRNTGTAMDSYSLLVSSYDESIFTISSIGNIANVGPDSFGTTTVDITIDPDAELASYLIEITAESNNNPSIKRTINLTVDITGPIYSFELSTTAPLNTREGLPGEGIEFTLQVRNSGTIKDTYEFRITSKDEALNVAEINSIPNLDKNTYGTTKAMITIDPDNEDALAGSYQVEITANSAADPSVDRVITLIVKVKASGEVELTPPTLQEDGEPEDTIDYTIRISNKGNAEDTFELTLEGTNKDWGEILDSSKNSITEITLNATTLPDSFADIIVRVTIPGTGETKAGQVYSITLKASSTNTEDRTDTATISTRVEDFVDLLLEYSGSGSPARDFDPNQKLPKFSFRATNNGNQDETGMEIIVIGTEWTYSPDTITETLEPGGTATFSIEFDIPLDESEGEYETEVYIRTSVEGSTEESNHVFITINITKPDLSVSSSDISGLDDVDYLLSRIDSAVTIAATIHNEGHSKAESVQVKLYANDVPTGGTKTISNIPPGASRSAEFRWNVEAEEVEFRLEITEQYEIDEGNNKISPIIVDLRPDLSFVGEQINFSNPNPSPGDKITITAFIRNSGGDAEEVGVNFFYGTKPIGSKSIDIDYEETGEASIEWSVPDKPGETYTIKVEIDLSGAIGDGDKETKSIKIAEEGGGVAGVFTGTGLTGMGIGLIIGALLFLIIGIAIGRRGGRARGPEGMAGPSFAAFEKEMPEGAEKKAPKAPAPFERAEEEAPPEEEERAKPKEIARVRCPKCGKVTEVTSTQRPLQIPCECGTTLMLKK